MKNIIRLLNFWAEQWLNFTVDQYLHEPLLGIHKEIRLNYFTIPSIIFLCNFQVLITLSQHQIKMWNRNWFMPFHCACPGGPLLPSLLPAAFTHHMVGSSPRNATTDVSQNILTGKLHFEESQCDDSSCDGLQSDLHCAWNTHASTGGENRRRVHEDVSILFSLIPEWSQKSVSLVTSQSPCRTVSALTCSRFSGTSLQSLRAQGRRNAGNLICYIRARCSKTALLYW